MTGTEPLNLMCPITSWEAELDRFGGIFTDFVSTIPYASFEGYSFVTRSYEFEHKIDCAHKIFACSARIEQCFKRIDSILATREYKNELGRFYLTRSLYVAFAPNHCPCRILIVAWWLHAKTEH